MTKTPEELTADWKEGKLPNKSIWWADLLNGKIEPVKIDEYGYAFALDGLFYSPDRDYAKIIAPCDYNHFVELAEKVKKLKEENIENLGYIGGLLNEGNEQVIKNRELRDLLKECKNIVAHDCWQEAQFPDGQVVERQNLLTRINAAIGESEE